MSESFSLYAVRNRDGQWLRAKGYGGYGDTWVKDIEGARLFPRLSAARARVSYFANHWPGHGPPEIVELRVSAVGVLDEAERNAKAAEKRKNAAEKAEVRRRAYELKSAQRALEAAEERLKKAQGG